MENQSLQKPLQQIVKFFFCSLLDENQIPALTLEAQKIYKNGIEKKGMSEAQAIIFATWKVWSRDARSLQKKKPTVTSEFGWIFPEGLKLETWIEFHRLSSEDELLALIWIYCLGYSEEEVCHTLDLSRGTLRTRIAKALKKLGVIAQPVMVLGDLQ